MQKFRFIVKLFTLILLLNCVLEKNNEKQEEREKNLFLLLALDSISPFGIAQLKSAKYSDTEVLIVGGNSQKSSAMKSLYKLTETEIRFIGNMNTARFQHEAVTLQNGKVLIVGGYDGRFILSDSEVFNPSANTTTVVSPMIIPRTHHTATLLNDGRVLVTGGFGKLSTKLKSAEIFHPDTNSFELIGNMNFSRRRHTATLLNNGFVLIVGGDGENESLASAEIFDPSNNTFTTVAQQMSVPRTNHTANLLDNNRVVISGGYAFDSNGIYSYSNSVEIFDYGTGNFTLIGNIGERRASHRSVKINSNVIICGGGRFESSNYFEPVDCYKVNNSGVLSKEPFVLQSPRVLFTFNVIGNSMIACGGESKDTQLRSCEKYTNDGFTFMGSQL